MVKKGLDDNRIKSYYVGHPVRDLLDTKMNFEGFYKPPPVRNRPIPQ